jgi:hypothetical protein
VTLVHPDMTREFENICKILYSERCPGDLSEETMKLFYDHTFEIGTSDSLIDKYTYSSCLISLSGAFLVGLILMSLEV